MLNQVKIITKNSYPNKAKFPSGTLCIWEQFSNGWLFLSPCDKEGNIYQEEIPICSFGKSIIPENGIISETKNTHWKLIVKNLK